MVAAAEQAHQQHAKKDHSVFDDLRRTFSPNRVGGRSSASKERTAGGTDEGQPPLSIRTAVWLVSLRYVAPITPYSKSLSLPCREFG